MKTVIVIGPGGRTRSMAVLTVDEMLAVPGVYEVANRAMLARAEMALVEVDAEGVAHQLNRDGKRDGVLSRDGFAHDTQAIRHEEEP